MSDKLSCHIVKDLLPLMAENLFIHMFSLLNTAMISASGVTS